MSTKVLPKNTLTLELEKLSQTYPRIKKILIVPNYQIGHQILEHLVRSGVSWINFTLATPASLAIGMVEDVIISNNVELLSTSMITIIVDSVFNNLSDAHRLFYFQKHPVNKGMVEALARTITELRLYGVTPENIKQEYFITKAKADDLRLMLAEYEKLLQENRLIDNAGLISLALGHIDKTLNKDKKIIVPSLYYMRGLERRFIKEIAEKNLVIANEDYVFGLVPPSNAWSVSESRGNLKVSSDSQRLSWLFDIENAPAVFKDGTIEIFSAVGYRNEVREILRRISKDKIKLDETEIIYTDSEKYLDLIYCLCDKLGILATFSEGVPFYMTNAGRALKGFLLWIKEDFQEIYLRRILESNGLKLEQEEDTTSGPILGYLLRTSGVGWGRERYIRILSKKIEELNNSGFNPRDERYEDDVAYLGQKIKTITYLSKICGDLLALIPEIDTEQKIDFSKLCEGMVNFLEKYTRVFNENDVFFVANAKETISHMGKLMQSRMIFEEALEKLINIVSHIRLRPSGPKPGHLHVSHYKNGGRSGRYNTFIVGLDESKFPEKIVQDPILLDEERKKLSPELELSTERLRKNIFEMASTISRLRGKVTFSYSTYDIKEDRKSFPTSLLLQAFRIKEGNPRADYNMLFQALGQPVIFSGASTELDEIDWWLNKLVDGVTLKDGMQAVRTNFPGIEEGLTALENKDSNIFTEFDGKVKVDSKEVDPRENKNLIMSCSRIETIAKCPFAYFLKYILNVRKPDEVQKDMTLWLDSTQRGTLLHEVFKNFIEQLAREKKSPTFEKQKEIILTILDEDVQRFKEEIPPPSETVFQNELIQFKRDVEVFLKINNSLKTEPIKWEISFGGEGEIKMSIPLGDNREIYLSGRIDRIDKAQGSEYHVWDYKTGSSYEFDERHYINGGEQLQHGLYAVVVEKLLKESGEDEKAMVTISGYFLPTERGTRDGKGGLFPKNTALKEKWQQALCLMFDIVRSGSFMVNNTGTGCMFCDYIEICDGENGKAQIKIKLENDTNKELQLWKKLKEKEYE